ncbi:MAG: carbohydrate binding family 9 domain-containing protein [Colwellia sp.]|nr:carbohydrate binding family 9 domain-containing protein [Colwellia sp.]
MLLRNSYKALVAGLFLLVCQNSFAEQNANDQKINEIDHLSIPYLNQKVTIDGDITDAEWSHALSIELNIVNSPWNNKPSPVKTTAKIFENGDTIYISFIAQDPNPEEIIAYLGDRDTRIEDDIVGIKLDTYNNRRLSYELFVNPHGAQIDRIRNELTGDVNSAWDGMWQSFGKRTPTGYQVEMAVPYHTLNFADTDEEKTWAIEFIRLYPRDSRLRISHVPLDRDNDCWLCQIPEAKGFKHAKTGNNVMITPAVVASKNDKRDIYDPQDEWHNDNETEAGVDLRWGINANTLLNVTVNPDFSTVESDAGQLNVNKTYSLYYQEARPFFVENSDYFTSNFNLVYTRNIADPDYGAKLTGTNDKHTYGAFISHDTETNYIVPGNTGSSLKFLKEESHSGAFKYRYDFSEDFSLGAISTLRKSDNYQNTVAGLNTKYRMNDSNAVLAQVVHSNSDYSIEQTDELSDQAMKVSFEHDSEYWSVNAEHQRIGKDFRADLGYMPKADYQDERLLVDRFFYGEGDSFWQEAKLSGQWQIKHNENGELLEKSLASSFTIDGPKLSSFDIMFIYADKIGLRHSELKELIHGSTALSLDDSIDGNTDRFTEKLVTIFTNIKPTTYLYGELYFSFGEKIDYQNNRIADYQEFYANTRINPTSHLEIDFSYTYETLDAKEGNVYDANLIELRVSYQFDVNSYLKLNVVYSDVDKNLDNNVSAYSKTNSDLSTQLIYSYKLNPQTVFFLGYSDISYRDDDLNDLRREERTLFTKISYAWMP